MNNRPRIVIAGQLPPPVGGQNVMIAHTLDVFRRDGRFDVEHLAFGFTRSWDQARAASLGKVVELGRVVARLLAIRLRGPIDCIVFPVGGPQRNPILRDMVLLPACYVLCRTVILHFHAGGIARTLDQFGTVMRRIVTWIYSRANAAVTLTNFGREDPLSLGVSDVTVVPNVLDDSFQPDLKASGKGTKLLYVGHLCEEKGTPHLLRVFASIATDFPDTHLYLMGEPIVPYDIDQLNDATAELGIEDRVTLLGVLDGDAKWRHFADSDLFVFPSQAPESFPLVLLEAMMWGIPVICTRWRGLPEVVGEPAPGILFEMHPSLDSGLDSALRVALRDPGQWQRWSEQSRSRFEEIRELASDEEPLISFVEARMP